MRLGKITNTVHDAPVPESPEDLLARCLATIPDTAQVARPRTWKERWRMPATRTGLALAAALAVTVAIVTTRPSDSLSGAAVLSATLKAMEGVPYFHGKGRSQGMWPGGGYQGGDGWYTGRWIESEQWFDAEHGFLRETKGETFAHQMSLALPSGVSYDRIDFGGGALSGDQLTIRENGPGDWLKWRGIWARGPLDAASLAPGISSGEVQPRLITTQRGQWKGRAAVILTFLTRPLPEKASRGCPSVRSLVYVDSATNLCMAVQSYAVSAQGKETLVQEHENDFSKRPDQSVFSPARLKANAGKVIRLKP